MAGQCLDGLTVDGRFGEVLQLSQGTSVKEDEGWAGTGVSVEAGQPGRSERLQIPGLNISQQSEGGPHLAGSCMRLV